MAAELITEDRPRIKFSTLRCGDDDALVSLEPPPPELTELCALLQRCEALGASPVLNDGLVGGNAAVVLDVGGGCSGGGGALYVTRSGKPPGARLGAGDFVRVTRFDAERWQAEYRSSHPDHRPTSDTPLLWASLSPDAPHRDGWGSFRPRVVVHGHALAEGAGLDEARRLGLAVSERETLFSTPEDLESLKQVLASAPPPAGRAALMVVRRGHGFFLLAETVAAAAAVVEADVAPFLVAQQGRGSGSGG